MAAVSVQALDHIVLRCADVEASLAWYCGPLGLKAERADDWRVGKVFFPSVRIDARTIIDLLPNPAPPTDQNVDHFCVVIEPVDLEALKASGVFEVVSGPGQRWGARGDGTSLYVLDPDRNVVELRHYGAA
ncbi:MAG: putative glutathione transferase [Actinomycetia bacterium]|jgi:catechol 2,3-dioxygenase-like lactoylglutathione lyase family enzyme|nr:putative glutathione transferase [Actinomycetes bacterium]